MERRMNEMVKRVARAICSAVDGRNPDHLIAVYEDRPCIGGGIMLPIHKRDWESYLAQARAAIAAMREPTEGMLRAWPHYEPHNQPDEVREGYQEMIDAAL
jgi:hypothetical protein